MPLHGLGFGLGLQLVDLGKLLPFGLVLVTVVISKNKDVVTRNPYNMSRDHFSRAIRRPNVIMGWGAGEDLADTTLSSRLDIASGTKTQA